MTKKEIDNLALFVSIHADKPEELGKIVKKVDNFLNLYFDLYIIQDYDKVQALRKKVYKKAYELYEARKKEEGAAD